MQLNQLIDRLKPGVYVDYTRSNPVIYDYGKPIMWLGVSDKNKIYYIGYDPHFQSTIDVIKAENEEILTGILDLSPFKPMTIWELMELLALKNMYLTNFGYGKCDIIKDRWWHWKDKKVGSVKFFNHHHISEVNYD